MKITFRLKGGKGSGHYGHEGRPGERGGSLPGKGGAPSKVSTPREALNAIAANPEMRKLAVATMADSEFADIASVTDLLSEIAGAESSYPWEGENFDEDAVSALVRDYEKARKEPGYWMELDNSGNPIMTEARRKWEIKWYGKVVGGFKKGERYATQKWFDFVIELGLGE